MLLPEVVRKLRYLGRSDTTVM